MTDKAEEARLAVSAGVVLRRLADGEKLRKPVAELILLNWEELIEPDKYGCDWQLTAAGQELVKAGL